MHVEQVLGDVPASGRCRCGESAEAVSRDASQAAPGGWLKSLFGGS
jgi:GTP cyclohydrolase II